jgi:lambda family phage tail tape measure protein
MADLKAQLQIGADVSGVEAGITRAKKSINSLGVAVQDANSKGAKSIDRYVQTLQTQAATMGKSSREADLYKLALKGASDQQLKAADTAIKMKEGYERGEAAAQRLRSAFVAMGAIAATSLIGALVAFDQLVKKAGDFQDMAEKFGDSGENFASLAVAAGTAGVQMDVVGSAAGKLTKNLTGVDDESKAAGAAITALGLNLATFKQQSPADQIETVAKALAGFEDGATKTAVAMALFGKSGADLLPFLKELGAEGGRQVILTQEQIRLADEYSDRQAKLRTEISLHAQALATELLPTITQFTAAIAELAKDQQIASAAVDLLKSAIGGGIVVFQTIAVVASDVGFVFKVLGLEVKATYDQLVKIATLDFTGFAAISEAVEKDAARARLTLDQFQARIMAIGQPKFTDPRILGPVGSIAEQSAGFRKKLTFDGGEKKGDKSAEQEAKARLAFDLEQIKKASESIIGSFSNGERMLEAARSAGLLDERDYYDQKLAFLRANAAEQEAAISAEINRLQREKLTGKDKIDNDRKILDSKAKLAKATADAAASEQVLATQTTAALSRQQVALLSARQAAQDYYDEVQRQQQRELASVGLGKRQRDLNAGVNQIEDRYANQRRDLENQRALIAMEGKTTAETERQYAERLRIINEFQQRSVDSYIGYYARLMEQQGNWAAGANEALQNYYDDSQDVFKGVEGAVTKAFQGMEDALVEFATTGKMNFKGLVNSIIADIARIVIRQNITGPLAKALQGSFGGGGSGPGGGFSSDASLLNYVNAMPSAKGNVFQSAGLAAYSNQIVNSPTLFAFARGAGLMGEAGPEAIMPLRRGADGRLGVEAAQGGGAIHIVNNLPAQIGKVSQRQTPDGDRVLVLEAVATALGDPQSRVSKAMQRNYGLSRNR